MAVDGHTESFMEYLSFSNKFFSKDSPQSSASGTSIDSFDRSKVKKLLESIKKDTKASIT